MENSQMKKLTVHILVTVPKEEHFDACTLVFDTFRTGFPTADLRVSVNPGEGLETCGSIVKLADRIRHAKRSEDDSGLSVVWEQTKTHHGDWIHHCVVSHPPEGGPLLFLDADTIFWESCENWTFPAETLLAGYYVPRIWNDFAKCVSMPRIHTSFIWIPDAGRLRAAIQDAYPPAVQKHGEYCPCDPFMPAVRFANGQPIFWDTCANLWAMLPTGTKFGFTNDHLAHYDHINSASFYDVMLDRLEDKQGFAYIHRCLANPQEFHKLRNLWPIIDRYYREKSRHGFLIV